MVVVVVIHGGKQVGWFLGVFFHEGSGDRAESMDLFPLGSVVSLFHGWMEINRIWPVFWFS